MSNDKNHSRKNGFIGQIYLLAYNFLQIIGWSYILYKLVNYYIGNKDNNQTLWETVRFAVNIFQNAAILEILNSITGLVKSNPVITTFQVLSRVVVVCGVIQATPSNYAAASLGLPLALLAWSITEIIRYSYYFTSLVGFIPYFLTWLRYTTFIILYPIGVTGELLCCYDATKYAISNPNAWSYTLPNAWNFTFSYHYTLLFLILLYFPIFPYLYLHMISLRHKTLGTTNKKKI
ncbi:PREDICTED: very-long-chain (3R)-3-hydroxyacyl-CoA dehydratase hpo-8 [Ceratosolen solmsi marchali]|uniref:Very-long-chain (3R)-3-hydroxyacyl-CoA dehydratase n=1 Tax=Ceratosolen solmsi marchali TaxID=326594 RepID=A0AAJ6YWB0_9HYME|nr:PREDICTED: very-long-chain (3R)-3-hydroxyacyl-CoA dehydratase hpo-8 [Ceratosolen solmsi marchali]